MLRLQVMPQTRASIEAAQASEKPIIIYVNKTDKLAPHELDARAAEIAQQLAESGISVEQIGGDIPV